ncbi:uncharacterized protein MONOS_16659 [Monocercomonoides exilis]|uniref:uncharacterized protein n=1 Tax=Monocercomonoides exilis TaxID=2049356 RepID=UPI00355A98E5|nr:hypothetical protein MONOS_16659 [Monocercomonoides exilis]|eukprot:MONOS_16659.1-p1 / transcript=MONOS_16659.1 / gene=MONOS_16659 / organism=Monocercomonoides_exilis_PA203 / gene_product=unspecified product / transcript_product=unspecified product / location=Mono_scaffold01976:568-2427(-) / protein_length=542 / sequence_SO=supercontig / SO=protein_coding / is_pseudo=false
MSEVRQCSCVNGKGGGVYQATKERGDLNFSFVGMKSSENRAKSDTIVVISVDGSNEMQCGTNTLPCDSIDYVLIHMTSDIMRLMFVVEEGELGRDKNLNEMGLKWGESRERGTSFFIPVLEEVKNTTQAGQGMDLNIHGKLLLPCNLSLEISVKDGDEEEIVREEIDGVCYISEYEVHSVVSSELVDVTEKKTEVCMSILFRKMKLSNTNALVVINKSEGEMKGDENKGEGEGDERISEGGEKIEWSLVAFIGRAAVLVVIVILFVMAVVQRKKQREVEKKVEEICTKEEGIEGRPEGRRERRGEGIEMSKMLLTLLKGMMSQTPLLIDNDEDLPEPPSMNDGILNENDLPDMESPFPFSDDVFVSGMPQSHSLNVISAKKPFREKEKKNVKTFHSAIHSVQGYLTLGTRAMDVIDGKEEVLAATELFEHLIFVGDERVEIMEKQLCSYSIFVEEGNNKIYVLTEKLKDEKEKEEMKRWKAPEAGEEDMEKTVVFTLGLILHEMTTEEVPLSECEAKEAQEMMRDGVRQLTEGIEGKNLLR